MTVKKQYGVIPYVDEKKHGRRIILITSRTNGYWIFPKGNPVKGKNGLQSAAQEAYEEAGLRGKITKDVSYSFTFTHLGKNYKTVLYPMKVETLLDDWPEIKERKRKTVSVSEALELITITELRKCLNAWKRDFNQESSY